MKYLVLFFLLVSTSLFSQDFVDTSEGRYAASIEYVGEYCGRQVAEQLTRNNPDVARTNVRLTTGQWEVVGTLLSRYQYNLERGNTFRIMMVRGINNIVVIFEMGRNIEQSTYYSFTMR